MLRNLLKLYAANPSFVLMKTEGPLGVPDSLELLSPFMIVESLARNHYRKRVLCRPSKIVRRQVLGKTDLYIYILYLYIYVCLCACVCVYSCYFLFMAGAPMDPSVLFGHDFGQKPGSMRLPSHLDVSKRAGAEEPVVLSLSLQYPPESCSAI